MNMNIKEFTLIILTLSVTGSVTAADLSCRKDSFGTTRCNDGTTCHTDSFGTTRCNFKR
ncbi:hypothetical protein SAMN05216339_11042 [Nitrosomonas eutropha]|uniref:Uncharacterized protein n=1 Tax=Nitrosomonas eutropha TaxID=916 RepID=A0A1I7IQX7_9PROT|nr:hypothetical protein SAMN05216339_11042 [Nitrosomonas eutropha]